MQVKTCRIGGALRLDRETRIVVHRRQGERVCLGATTPAGMALMFDHASIRPQPGTAGRFTFLFSLHAVRRFVLGRFEVQLWLPGELVPQAADCLDAVHIGFRIRREAVALSSCSQALPPAPRSRFRPWSGAGQAGTFCEGS